jgi:hypothetical protein
VHSAPLATCIVRHPRAGIFTRSVDVRLDRKGMVIITLAGTNRQQHIIRPRCTCYSYVGLGVRSRVYL